MIRRKSSACCWRICAARVLVLAGLAALSPAAWVGAQQYQVPPGYVPAPGAVPVMPGGAVPALPPGVVITQPPVLVGGVRSNFQQTSTSERIKFVGPVSRRTGQLGYSTKSRLQISVEAPATSQFGYQPVVVAASVRRAAASDRTIRVRFHAGGWYNDGESISVVQTFELPQGAKSATTTLLVPQYQDWQLCGWEVSVDRQPDDELGADRVNLPQQTTNFAISALVVSTNQTQWQLQQALQVIGNGASSIHVQAPGSLSTNWLHYSTYDVVVIDAADLPKFVASDPDRAAALFHWVRAGGSLWLTQSGDSWEELPAAERALGLRASTTNGAEPENAAAADQSLLARGWHFAPLNERASDPVEGALELSGYDMGDAGNRPVLTPASERTLDAPAAQPTPAAVSARASSSYTETSRDDFAVRAHGLGIVAAFRTPLAGAGNSVIPAVQRSLLMPRLTSIGRHGNKPDEANSEFNKWLIQGVGVAPVGYFQVLISLFVLAIGPLNYWWLKRQKKLPMLLATVPAAAVVVTCALLVFGILADGFGVRIRARSFTRLDQVAGESATWARVSYYAGIAPRDGLSMPPDALVYPILSNWSVGRYGQGPTLARKMTWDKNQQLQSGWLQSRTPTQYMSINARPTKKRLELRNASDGMRIVNRLGVTVTHLVVQDRSGKLYWCENLPPDEGRIVPLADEAKISGRLRSLFSDNYPEFPAGGEDGQYGRGYGNYGVQLSQSLLEAQIEAINSPIVQKWTNGSYIAVTDRGIEVDLGVDDATEEGSFHVIRGTW